MQRIYLTLLSTTCAKVHQAPYVIFETISHFSRHNSSLFFLAQTLHTFYSISSKCKFAEFPLVALKFTKFLMSFFFEVWITLQCHERQFFCSFLAETLYAIDKSSASKCKFSDFLLLTLKFIKFLISFLEPRVSFSSNFASLFSVMRHNSSVLFHRNLYMLKLKCNFLDFRLLA